MVLHLFEHVAEVEDHGGSLEKARQMFPHAEQPWMDLSTGINPYSYPQKRVSSNALVRLPESSQIASLAEIAAEIYGARKSEYVVPAPGTQILVPMIAGLIEPGRALILGPTYQEHSRCARIAGHKVEIVRDVRSLGEADLAIVVNPNNPDGRLIDRNELLELAGTLRKRNGLLLVDEAFMDVAPMGFSISDAVESGNIVVLRSFGKFFGMAGVRLGFAIADRRIASRLSALLGPWAISGPALEAGMGALSDRKWQSRMKNRLAIEARALDRLLQENGLTLVGGANLFRLVMEPDEGSLHARLGRRGILVRNFSGEPGKLRFGLPKGKKAFARLQRALEESKTQAKW